jgi:uncharacterized repeat protein (TIGR03803 family)
MIGRIVAVLTCMLVLGTASAQAQTYSNLYSFCAQTGCADGAGPQYGLIADTAGNLFGTAGQVVFELSPDGSGGWTYSVIHVFCTQTPCPDGSSPSGSLIVDSAGNLYGVTQSGGKGAGIVYELMPQGGGQWKFFLMSSFCKRVACIDGEGPSGGLSYFGQKSGAPYDGTSPLYGTTQTGGEYQKGTVYRLTPPPAGAKRTWWKSKTLYSFCPEGGGCLTDGYQPKTGVVVDSNHLLYGTTNYGGQFYSGTVFKLTRSGSTWAKQILHTMCSANHCADGAIPLGLTENGAGDLFGVTMTGQQKPGCAKRDCGTVFELSPQTGDFTTLYAFCSLKDCADGDSPSGPVTILDNGDLIGATATGGDTANHYPNGGGVLYRLSGTTFSVLNDFCASANCLDGEWPSGSIAVDAQGRMFGATIYGGDGAYAQGGLIYEFTP